MKPGTEGGRATPEIGVQFAAPGRRHAPGGPLVARYCVGGVEPEAIRALEVSVAWYTEGKGEEDLVVHAFERIQNDDAVRRAAEAGVIETVLPPSPLSYEGVIVKIRWCLRVRVFFVGGRDYVSEHVFEVGEIPPARPVAVDETAP